MRSMSNSVVEQALPRVSIKGRGTPPEWGLLLKGIVAMQASAHYEGNRGFPEMQQKMVDSSADEGTKIQYVIPWRVGGGCGVDHACKRIGL